MIALDASMALSWIFEDEQTPATERLFDEVADTGAVVPALWWLELANVLRTAVRRGRCDEAYVDVSLGQLAELPIETDEQTAERAGRETLALSRGEGLTPYDACYLEVALRRGLPLATRDDALAVAATRRTVRVLGA